VPLASSADGLPGKRVIALTVLLLVLCQSQQLLASGAISSVTPGQYARANANASTSYGFSAASDEGSLSFWMGSSNQASMWNALGDARKAAGGDAALKGDATRVPLLEAEASRWFAAPGMIAPTSEIIKVVDQFRAVLGSVYRGAGKVVPTMIAPIRIEAPPTPRATH